nr:DUF6233 domain-containing protein [Streptomyces himalayensis]
MPTEYLEPPSLVEQALGPRRPSGWVLQKTEGRGPGRGVVHAVDCKEAPAGAPVLTLDKALDAAQHPGTRLCALCGAAAELDPVPRGFDRGWTADPRSRSYGVRRSRPTAERSDRRADSRHGAARAHTPFSPGSGRSGQGSVRRLRRRSGRWRPAAGGTLRNSDDLALWLQQADLLTPGTPDPAGAAVSWRFGPTTA